MTVEPIGFPTKDVSRKWLALAEKRLAYYATLCKTGRWQRYYARDQFIAVLADVIRGVKVWETLAGRKVKADLNDLRPAA